MNSLFFEACAGCAQIVKCGCALAAPTNAYNRAIVGDICGAVVLIALIGVVGYVFVKLIAAIFHERLEKKRRTWEVENRQYKREADLEEKLLDIHKQRAEKYAWDDESFTDYKDTIKKRLHTDLTKHEDEEEKPMA